MKQRIFTPQFCEDLEANINENLDKYNNPDFSWEDEAKSQDAIRESNSITCRTVTFLAVFVTCCPL